MVERIYLDDIPTTLDGTTFRADISEIINETAELVHTKVEVKEYRSPKDKIIEESYEIKGLGLTQMVTIGYCKLIVS